jgi:GNAT superfamily N-acetyltransferase/ABC-type transport system involved in cytochrome c biogenesis ATPase subunit
MKFEVRNRTEDVDSYRVARVKSLFNSPPGGAFDLDAELPIEENDWRLGLIVGPSGTGKTSLGRMLFEGHAHEFYEPGSADWPDTPIVDAIQPDGDFDSVTGALAAVGLGTVPTWLRPYRVLSGGERFRADLARIVCEAPERIVVDEFTSVVDRQIAKVGALAFSKAWRRTGGQAVLLSCHYDIAEWLQPDWIFDTATGECRGRESLQPRPAIEVDIQQTDWSWWPLFEPHHYLKMPKMIAARCYVAFVDGEPVAHLAVGTANRGKQVEARACRLVVMPEWQGAGVGMRFLNHVCQLQLEGGEGARLEGRPVNTIFHTSHPGLSAALRRDRKWRQVSAVLHGVSKAKSGATMRRRRSGAVAVGYGGHLRAVQGFRFYGDPR